MTSPWRLDEEGKLALSRKGTEGCIKRSDEVEERMWRGGGETRQFVPPNGSSSVGSRGGFRGKGNPALARQRLKGQYHYCHGTACASGARWLGRRGLQPLAPTSEFTLMDAVEVGLIPTPPCTTIVVLVLSAKIPSS